MRSLVVFKSTSNDIYHVDLDNETAIGISVTMFDPARPDVSRVNNSNEFTVPKTRNNIATFDGIFNSERNINDGTDYNYDCMYFVDNYLMVQGKIYLTGATDDRISMFIYDKSDIIQKMKDMSFGQFEKQYSQFRYYSFEDWPASKSIIGGVSIDFTNCFPNDLHPALISDMPETLWKEQVVSGIAGSIVSNFQNWKQLMLNFLNSIDPAYQLKVFWNACISKWRMDLFNFVNKEENGNAGFEPSQLVSWRYSYNNFINPYGTPSSDSKDIDYYKKNEYWQIRQASKNIYFPVKVGQRSRFIVGTGNIQRLTNIAGESLTTGDEYMFVDVMDNDDAVVMSTIESFLTTIYNSRDGLWNLVSYNKSDPYATPRQEVIPDNQTLLDLMDIIFAKIRQAQRNRRVNGVSIDEAIELVNGITPDTYSTLKPTLDTMLSNMLGNHTYDMGTLYKDGVSNYDATHTQLPVTYESGAYIADENGITAAPSLSIIMATTQQQLIDWNAGMYFIGDCYNAINTYDYTYLSNEKYKDYKRITYFDGDESQIPTFRLFPTSYSDEDVATYDNITGLTDNIKLYFSKGVDKIYSGSLYVSTYQILEFLKSQFDIDIDDVDSEGNYKYVEFLNYFTNVPDITIQTTGNQWYWGYTDEGITTKTPKNKTMYDWIMMICKVHSFIPIVIGNRLYLRKYSSLSPNMVRNDDLFNLVVKGSLEWKACGEFDYQTYYVDFSSGENGVDIHINTKSPISISNSSLNSGSSVLYTTGVHRCLTSTFETSPQASGPAILYKSSGSDNFLYTYYDMQDNGSGLHKRDAYFTFSIYGEDYDIKNTEIGAVGDGMYLPKGDYITQVSNDVQFLRNLIEPYPVIYEMEVYMTFDDVVSIITDNLNSATLYYIKQLNGYYYITKISNINGYNRKTPVRLQLYKYTKI